MFKIERQEPVACLRSRSDGFEQTINWLLNKESRSTVNILDNDLKLSNFFITSAKV